MTDPQKARRMWLSGWDTQFIANVLGITEAALYNAGWHRASYKPPALVHKGQRPKIRTLRYAYGPFLSGPRA